MRHCLLLSIIWNLALTVSAADNFTLTPNGTLEVPVATLQEFTVHWDKDGAPQVGQPLTISKTFGELVIDTLPLQTDDKGDAKFAVRSSQEGEGNLTVGAPGITPLTATVKFVPAQQEFTLTVNLTGSGTVAFNPTDAVNCGEGTPCIGNYPPNTTVTLTATADTNAVFSHWGGDCTDLPNPAVLTLDKAKTCDANFVAKTFVLKINLTGEGVGTVSSEPAGIQCKTGVVDCQATYNAGTTVTLTPTAATGSLFTTWQGLDCQVAGEQTDTAAISMTQAITCTARFQPLLKVQVVVSGNGTITSQPLGIECGAGKTGCQAEYAKGTAVTLTATPADDSLFNDWKGEKCLVNTDTSITLALNEAKYCTAQFIVLPPLSIGIINTITGIGSSGYNNNVPALQATFRTPADVALDNLGNLYIADTFNSVIRKVSNLHNPDPATHLVTTSAGDGTLGYSGEAVNATAAQLHWPYSVATDAANNLYIADTLNNLIRKVTPENTITTLAGDKSKAGSKTGGYSGDHWIALAAEFNQPRSLALDSKGAIYIADFLNHVIRKIDATTQIITTVAGTGQSGYSGDGGPALEAKLNLPLGIALDAEDNLYIADSGNQVVRKVTFGDSAATLSSVEGTNGLNVVDVAVNAQGQLFLADRNNHVIHQLDPDGTLSVVAGIPGQAGYSGAEEGVPANQAHLNTPVAVTLDAGGNLYIADSANNRIRLVTMNASLLLKKTETGSGQGNVLVDETPKCPDATLTTGCVTYLPTNSKVILTAEALEGFTFTRWEGDCNGTENPKTIFLNNNKQCQVNFEPLYALTLEKTGTGHGLVTSTPGGIQCGETCTYPFAKGTEVALTAAADADSLFKGWSKDCGDTVEESTTVVLDAAKTCQALFELLPKLTVVAAGNGQVVGEQINCGNECEAVYAPGTEVTLTAQPVASERFLGWSGDCKGTELTVTLTLDKAKTCTATFAASPRLTVKRSGKGQGTVLSTDHVIECGEDCEEAFANDTNITLTAVAGGGSQFISWEEDCLGMANPATLRVDGAKVCTANFGLLPGLNVKVSGNGAIVSSIAGIQCGDDCSEPYADGTQLTLTATPQTDSRFVEWSENCTGATNPLPVTVVGTVQCTATFELLNAKDNFTVTPDTVPGVLVNSNKIFTIHWDRAGIPQADQSVAISATLGTVTPTPVVLDANGNGQFSIRSDVTGATTVSIATATPPTAGGHTKDLNFEFFYSDDVLTLTPDTLQFVLINTEQTFTVHWDKAGVPQANAPIELATSLGTVPKSVTTDAAGNATFTITSDKAGLAMLIATAGLPSAQVSFNFVDNFSSIQFAAPHYLVNEADGKVILLVSRAASAEGTVSAGFEVVDGSARVTTDYQPPAEPFTLTWGDKDSVHKTIEIPILKDPSAEEDKSFTVRLTGVSGNALLGKNAEATVTIIDTPSVGSLQFSAPDYRASEVEGAAVIAVDRIGGDAGEVTVEYRTQDGSAKAGQDYTLSQGTLRWSHGEVLSKNFSVPILVDNQEESEKALTLSLGNVTGGARIGAIATATLRIVDELGSPTTPIPETAGRLEFTEVDYETVEGADSTVITVARLGGKKGVVAINYATVAETAQASRDFMAISGELRWLDGEDASQTIVLQCVNDGTVEELETLSLELSNPQGGAELGDNARAKITILDDDAASIQFETDSYVVAPKQTSVTLTVVRKGSNIGQIAVTYATQADSALEEVDYQPTSGLLVWESGDTQPKTVTVPLLTNKQTKEERAFTVVLSDLQGEATLAEPYQATVLVSSPQASACKPTQLIDCYLFNEDSLADVTVTKEGAIVGGTLGGTIINDGVLQNVALLAGSKVTAGPFETGVLKGRVRGDPENRPLIEHQTLAAEAVLSQLILGAGVNLDPTVILKEGVCFQNNSAIPAGIGLEGILGYLQAQTFGNQAVKLTQDVLCLPAVDGIVGAINGLPDFYNNRFVITQNPRQGFLELDVAALRYAVLPLQARQSWLKQSAEQTGADEPLGLVIAGGEVIFITHTGREIHSVAIVQAPLLLRSELNRLGLNTLTLQANGNLQVPKNGETYFSARASLFSEVLAVSLPVGINTTDLVPPPSKRLSWLPENRENWILGIPAVYLVFTQDDGILRQQFIYPSPADPQALGTLGEAKEPTDVDGRVFILRSDKSPCVGILDYAVTPTHDPIIRDAVQCLDIEDVNGDGLTDYRLLYPNGDQQILYRLAS